MVKTNKEIRRKQREEVIQKLYEIDINEGINETESTDDYVKASIKGVLSHRDLIDRKIQDNLTNWSLSRLTYIDRAIIRFATYEIIYSNLPSEIIINEALVLTRKYSDEGNNKMVGFTNKVLDNIKEAIK
ncbi:MAG: transcription antitermination factor NusB [Candidatus Izimaplasma sp.]|nr:transcription antitermination factor NusB [Candidatus Izimaplasma bacterium]